MGDLAALETYVTKSLFTAVTDERWVDKPPPCTLFYLSMCKHGVDCKYAHDYILEAEHYEEMRLNAKKAPCPALNKGRHVMASPHFRRSTFFHSQEKFVPGEMNASTVTFAPLGSSAISLNREGVNLREVSFYLDSSTGRILIIGSTAEMHRDT